MKIALTIAGSDSGGGAGIQADLKTFHQFGVFGTSAIVALTAQNTMGVTDVHAVPAAFVRAQLDALAADLSPEALKTGMLANAELVAEVARSIARHGWRQVIVDPVMVASSGDRLLDDDAESAIREQLLPLAALVTPNLDEAERLTGIRPANADEMEAVAAKVLGMGARAVLIKGGHGTGGTITDVLVTATGTRRFTHDRIATRSTHGTGCTLSAAITAGLALGHELEDAVERALDYVARAIRHAPDLGRGIGPLNHAVAVSPR